VIASTIANIYRTERSQPYKITDLMVDWEPVAPKEQTPEEQLQIIRRLQKIQNAGRA
jgi:hypothetical protein